MTREEELELENKQLKMAVEELELYINYLLERIEKLELGVMNYGTR